MRVSALGEAATQLPWLCPSAASLLALARLPSASAWAGTRDDPGAVLHILRQTARILVSPAISFFPAVLRDAAILQGAIHFLNRESETTTQASTPGIVDWNQPALQPIYHASIRYARTAQRLAELTGRCDPENAWVTGLLAPLGWLAVCAVAPDHAAACLADQALADDPTMIQERHWGYSQAAIARRLLRLWHLPDWITAIVGHLGLPVEFAQIMGADPELFQVVQMAVGLVEEQGQGLHLEVGSDTHADAAALGLATQEVERLAAEVAAAVALTSRKEWLSPHAVPLLLDLLRLAAEKLSLQDAPTVEQLQRAADQLHRSLEDQQRREVERLQALKLNAMAEFAAGAAHEINNPLAVISGQAQYLLIREPEPARQKALQTIVGQTQRIHQHLNELMQFARPPRPERQIVDAGSLLREVLTSLNELAGQRQVLLVSPEPVPTLNVYADPRQIGTALECLLRNAIEAAPAGGWAGIRLDAPAGDRLDFVVEDSGHGPTAAQRDHLFDPFYSGRPAGRGRGLGLPTAWRFARQHGGDVRFDKPLGGPTQFILSLPTDSVHSPEPCSCTPLC